MCGIAGIINFNNTPADRTVLETMTHVLAHRGPDGSGVEIRGPVGFGHRRLSIIDPAGGKQPMFNEDRQVWVTFNGEIYNYQELRHELQAKGHRFTTNSDTETIVHAYEQWGEQCVERFRGMFAFAIMDWRQGKIFIARDQFGIKPLFYVQTGTTFAFASEQQALLHVPGVELDLDLTAVDQYLWLQYIPAPRTAFKQIKKLPPAHRMSITLDGRVTPPQEYWRLQFTPDEVPDEQEWIEALDATLRDSVKAHLVSDVPFGAFLSGGVDSSLVIAYMTQVLEKPVTAFSIGFEESDFNEIDYARIAARQWGAKHHVEIVRPDALQILPDLVRCYGDLFGDSSAIPTYYVSQMARKQVPMILSGDGADESFAGYWSYGNWMSSFDHNPAQQPTLDHWLKFINYVPVPHRKALWRPEHRHICPAPLELFEQEFARTAGYTTCQKVQHLDLKTYLPYAILTKVDIASMMHGLEVRPPFVDIRVVELASKIPERFNISRNAQGGWDRKLLLRKVAERYYPREFLDRPKMGFAVPIAKWFAQGGELHDVLRERLLGRNSTLTEFFEPEMMSSLMAGNATGPLWLLLFMEEWLRQNRSRAVDHQRAIEVGADSRTSDSASESTSSRPRILLIADVPNWIFERHCNTLKRNLSAEFDFTIIYKDQPFIEDEYDLIYPLEWYMVPPDRIGNPAKYVSGIRSHLVWTDHPFTDVVRYLSNRFNVIHVVSRRLHDLFAPHLPNLAYVTHGVDTAFFTPSTQADQSGRKLRLGWAGNRKSVGKKGFAEFVEPLSHLPGVELVFCGYSDRNLSLDEMRDFYDSLDAYVCASDFEGSNNSLLEAASMARAIITTDNGTVPEYLRHGESAFIVERELPAFIGAVETLRDNPALRVTLGAKAREAVQKSWDWKTKCEEYRQMFRIALERQAQGLGRKADGKPSETAAPKRVLIACTHFWPSIGGVETIAENLGVHLLKDGYQIDIATLEHPNRISDKHRGCNIISLKRGLHESKIPLWVLQLRQLAISGDYSACILLSNPTTDLIWSIKGAQIPSHTKIIIQPIINVDDYRTWQNNREFRARLSALLKQATATVALTQAGVDVAFMAEDGVKPVFLPNAVDYTEPHINFRQTYNIPDNCYLILHVANLYRVKNHVGLLKALRGLPDDCRLVIIGHPAGEQDYIREFTEELSRNPRAIHIPGLASEGIAAAMAASDVVVLSSHGEVSPVCILEAMSHRKPWLATPTCGTVNEHAGGIVTELESFLQTLMALKGNPNLSQKLGEAGYGHWHSCYSWPKVVKGWEELIDRGSMTVSFDMPRDIARSTEEISTQIRILARSASPSLSPASRQGGTQAKPSAGRAPFRVIALISAHNEGDVIYHVIGDMVRQGIEVYLINHCSTDETVAEASKWLGKGLIHIENFPQDAGYPEANSKKYVWSQILKRKEELAAQLDADWFIHSDADEFREAPWPEMTLKEGIWVADKMGFSAIDFELLNFRPVNNSFVPGTDVRTALTMYEGCEDFNAKQIKAWKKPACRVDIVNSGGHDISFEGRKVFPVKFILRHYPIRSQEHGIRKVFEERKKRFHEEERKIGWHVQYDSVTSHQYNFIHDPATLTPYDGNAVRLRLLSRNALAIADELCVKDPLSRTYTSSEEVRYILKPYGKNYLQNIPCP